MEGVGDSLLPTLVKPDQAKANSFIIHVFHNPNPIVVGMVSITSLSTKSVFVYFKIRQCAIFAIRLQ
jgi:hypothetical protein